MNVAAVVRRENRVLDLQYLRIRDYAARMAFHGFSVNIYVLRSRAQPCPASLLLPAV